MRDRASFPDALLIQHFASNEPPESYVMIPERLDNNKTASIRVNVGVSNIFNLWSLQRLNAMTGLWSFRFTGWILRIELVNFLTRTPPTATRAGEQ